MKNTGKIVGTYFYIIGTIQLGLILGSIFEIVNFVSTNGSTYIDLSFILFFWAGRRLFQYNPKWRTGLISFNKLVMGLIILSVVFVTIWGLPESSIIRFGGIPFSSESGSIVGFYLVSIITFIGTLFPFLILNSEIARKEFETTH